MNDHTQKTIEILKKTTDVLLPFQLEKSIVRGRVIRLSAALNSLFARHHYPSVVEKVLAESVVMAAAFGSAMKFDGVFTLQTQTDGAVSRLVVDVTSGGDVRACATFDSEKVAAHREDSTDTLLGTGHLVFTVDQKIGDERYQGVVKLEGDSLSEAFQLYFKQSEQIPTGILTAAEHDEDLGWVAACLMVQRMPRYGGEEVEAPIDDTAIEDDWFRVMSLMQTCTHEELLDLSLPTEDLLFRLFHEEGVRVYDPITFRERCRCSREKIMDVLASVSQGELEDMTEEDGLIRVTCQFCSESHEIKPEDVKRAEKA